MNFVCVALCQPDLLLWKKFSLTSATISLAYRITTVVMMKVGESVLPRAKQNGPRRSYFSGQKCDD